MGKPASTKVGRESDRGMDEDGRGPSSARSQAGRGNPMSAHESSQGRTGFVLGELSAKLDEIVLDFHDPRFEGRRLFSELFGTFFLVLVAAGGAVVNAK